jgi:hypothetical protein
VDAVLGEREEHIHHREREEDARVDEDTRHGSVRKVCVGCRIGDRSSAIAATVALLSERKDIGKQDAAMATARQSFRRDRALIEQASHKRSGEPEQFPSFGGGEDRVATQHGDGVPVGEFTC